MEQSRAHDPKKNTKTIPVALNIGAGAGSFGISGIVLLGGALVATTVVSVLAFKRRKQHQSSSENISPSDDVTSMKEMESKTIQHLTKDEKHNSGSGKEEADSEDSNEDGIHSMVGEGQEDTSVDDSYEKVVLECEEQVVMKVQIEEDSCLEIDDGCEEQEYSMMIDDEKDGSVDASLLVNDETISSIEEYQVIEAPLRDNVAKESEKEEEEKEEDYEKVFINEEAATEDGCLNHVKVNDNSQEQFPEEEKEKNNHDETFLENYVGDLSDETGYAEQLVHVMEEEAIDTTRAKQTEIQNHSQMNTEDILEMADDDEFVLDAQEVLQVNKDCETLDVPCITDNLNEAVDDQITRKEDDSLSQLNNTEKKGEDTAAHEVKEQVIIEDDMLLPLAQPIEETEIDDQTVKIQDKPPTQLVNEEKEDVTDVQVEAEMNTEEDESVRKERISKEDEVPSVTLIDDDVKVMSSNKSSDELEDNFGRILGRVVRSTSYRNGIIKDDKGSKSPSKKQVLLVSEPWNLKLMTWSLLVSIWCLCHWYSELPYPQLSLVGSLLFVLILLGCYRNRTTYLV
ncbi:uncharacterized protein [Rutidosis leptorrhynchoides]|uniref:uncharacterized protein n=1 Tax=Rutidosis leptorrhynchoides TaxID=125765 RepID=UPI003A9A2E09